MILSSHSEPTILLCFPGSRAAPFNVFASERYKISIINVDLPEPETPVTQTKRLRGILTLMFFRLFSRAPRISKKVVEGSRRFRGYGITLSPRRYAHVELSLFCKISGIGPAAII